MAFQFKQFKIDDNLCAMKVGTDGVLLGAWASIPQRMTEADAPQADAPRILDLGTGSGLIALMLAQRCPTADITAIDLDRQAALQARANFDASPWADRLHAYWADAKQFEDPRGFDLIVSNPPYFCDGLCAPDNQRSKTDQRTLARHTDSLALADLFATAARLLKADGCLCLVLPSQTSITRQSRQSSPTSPTSPLVLQRLTRVYTKPTELKRLLLEYKKRGTANAAPLHIDDLILSGCGPWGRSPEYQALTQDFYL